MIVLGIHDGHCASACVTIDGKLKAIVAEERFTRLKNDHGYPLHAIDFCLDTLGLKPEEIDRVAFAGKSMNIFSVKLKALSTFQSEDWIRLEYDYWKPLLYDGVNNIEPFRKLYKDERFANLKHYYDFSGITADEAINSKNPELSKQIRLQGLKSHLGISEEKVVFFDHHTCHAAYALFSSEIREDNTMIYTLDGGGDSTTSSVFRFHEGRLQEINRSNSTDIARIYRYMTLLMGMKLGEHEYKVMGLAPYAPDREFRKSWQVFDGMFEIENDLISYVPGKKPKDKYFHLKKSFEAHRFDGMAAATQYMVEESVIAWIEKTMNKYQARNVVFAGGVAMNVKLNMLLAEKVDLDGFYVPPSPSDDTLPIGACYLAEYDENPEVITNLSPVTDPYLGPRHSEVDIREAIRATGADNRFRVVEGVTSEQIAGYLADGKIVARMGGRMEFGQRALGNRSIIADPRQESIVEKINHQIKYRDFWMPFAPAVLEERTGDYFIKHKTTKSLTWSYMMVGARTTELGAKELPAAIHRGDNTARPQVVRREQNPAYYDIIKSFEKQTGTGVVLNTSFNLHGEPIVNSPIDAISTFERSELDVLVMEDIALLREES